MVSIDLLKIDYNENEKVLLELKKALNLDGLEEKKKELEQVQQQDGFWNDMSKAQSVNKELARIENKIKQFKALESRVEDLGVLISLSEEENDENEFEAIDEENKKL